MVRGRTTQNRRWWATPNPGTHRFAKESNQALRGAQTGVEAASIGRKEGVKEVVALSSLAASVGSTSMHMGIKQWETCLMTRQW